MASSDLKEIFSSTILLVLHYCGAAHLGVLVVPGVFFFFFFFCHNNFESKSQGNQYCRTDISEYKS